MASKAQKRRQRRQTQSARDMQRRWEAQDVPPIAVQEDPCVVVMDARRRRLRLGDTKADQALVEWEGMGDMAGVAIALAASGPSERDDLWSLFKRLDAAHEVYHRRIIGKPRFPACSKLEFLPERFETRPDDRPDARTSDEKDADPRATWARWLKLTGEGSIGDRIALWDGIWMRCDFVRHGEVTQDGAAFVRALRGLLETERRA